MIGTVSVKVTLLVVLFSMIEMYGDRITCLDPLCVQVSSHPSSVQLLSILQALLLVGPDRAEVWCALELLIDRATLLAQDGKYEGASSSRSLGPALIPPLCRSVLSI